jgi:hypothetical protein
VELRTRSPTWFARKVRQVCDEALRRLGKDRETVRSETVKPSFSNSPWIRGAPHRKLSALMRRMMARSRNRCVAVPAAAASGGASIHGTLRDASGRPWPAEQASTRPSIEANHRRKHNQNQRSDGRKRRSERASTPSWWGRARYSRTRSRRAARADQSVATVSRASRIVCTLARCCANVNDFRAAEILTRHNWIDAELRQQWDDRWVGQPARCGAVVQCDRGPTLSCAGFLGPVCAIVSRLFRLASRRGSR